MSSRGPGTDQGPVMQPKNGLLTMVGDESLEKDVAEDPLGDYYILLFSPLSFCH